ncbi:MAG TPA: PilZ domain-containing protein [Sphingomicrobium sp.]|jgi:hypothetical protein
MNMIGEGFRNRRRAPRASVLLPASVVTMSAYQYLEVVNLSPTGAKLRGSPRPEVGKTAMFRLDGFQLLCKIVWAKDDLCGVRFDELIPPRVLAMFRDAGNTAKLGMLTPAEQQAAEEWAAGAGE